MAGKPKPARIRTWQGDHYLFYFDYATGKQIRKKCTALKAFTYDQRKELEKQYRAKELDQQIEVAQAGGRVDGNARLADDINLYLEDCKERAGIREANPKAGMGISAATQEIITRNVGHFKDWIAVHTQPDLRTKDLDPHMLKRYIRFVVTEGTKLGTKKALRSANTINQYIRNVKTCIRWISHLKPRRILDREALMDALQSQRGKRKMGAVAFSPDQLKGFLQKAVEREQADFKAVIKRKKNGKEEEFEQTAPSTSATPASRLFLLLALTGCRRGEALGLKWEDVDLDRGRITIHAQKTGMERWVPLKGAAEGEIAPQFCELLEQWWEEDKTRTYVLPHGDLDAPQFPKKAWEAVLDELDMEGKDAVGPQRLRQNFTSYAASLGIPASVAAMWQGHSAEVAQRHYRAQVLDRNPHARTFEEAMGLDEVLTALLTGSRLD
ncbi:MAG: tyrosine-type recombinase/integrase [Planctomycetes bacterium]|nr:tyrosine-type recombinase/integrase [Planctomycetota bacterium]